MVRALTDLTWTEVRDLAAGEERLVAILPLGAVEAHGPHLPLGTDGIIAVAMARAGARRLAGRGWAPLLLPSVEYSAAPFAADFAGTLSLPPETMTAVIVGIGRELARQGVGHLAIANAHLDPAHLGSVHAAVDDLRAAGGPVVAFPDLTRKPWALRLGDEFGSGACHAGRFEGSVVLAERRELVREATARDLPVNPSSLSRAIAAGKGSFAAAGGPAAYFGDPAAATAGEGRDTVERLGAILAEAVAAQDEGGTAAAD